MLQPNGGYALGVGHRVISGCKIIKTSYVELIIDDLTMENVPGTQPPWLTPTLTPSCTPLPQPPPLFTPPPLPTLRRRRRRRRCTRGGVL